jgi:hypothetical protein
MSKELAVGPDLRFPLDAVTQTFALLGVRRSGKSNAAEDLAHSPQVRHPDGSGLAGSRRTAGGFASRPAGGSCQGEGTCAG